MLFVLSLCEDIYWIKPLYKEGWMHYGKKEPDRGLRVISTVASAIE